MLQKGATALIKAALHDRAEVVGLLLDRGADLEAKSDVCSVALALVRRCSVAMAIIQPTRVEWRECGMARTGLRRINQTSTPLFRVARTVWPGSTGVCFNSWQP